MSNTPTRDTVTFDTYAGLRRIGYTHCGAIDALQILGISADAAVAAATNYEPATQAAEVHAFDFRGQALCGSSNDQDGDAPASHDPAEVTCRACQRLQDARTVIKP